MTETALKYYSKNRPLFTKLVTEKESGKIYKRTDLTEDILYTLAIEENATDRMIGELFGLSISQVCYLRKKYGLQNKILKKSIEHPERILAIVKEQGCDTSTLSNQQFLDLFYTSCRDYAKSKNWNIDYLNRCLMEKQGEHNIEDSINLSSLEFTYNVIYTNKIHQSHKKSISRKTNGSRVHQGKAFRSKRIAGILGEKIVYDSEIKKLKEAHLEEFADKVIWISKPDKEESTYDGKGYDIISYNEKKEKIYIEVKCSTTNHTNDVIFDISDKEVALMNGKLVDDDNNPIDKEHCFIYYVSNINQTLKLAEIFIINHTIFSTYQLTPTHYRVQECYQHQ